MTAEEIIDRLLAKRGIDGDEARAAYFDPTLRRLGDPSALPGVYAAVETILPYLTNGRLVVVFGDYDCDGVCATAIMVRALRLMGVRVAAFIPNRFREGYGMTAASLERLRAEHPDAALVVTVDNGVNAIAEVADLKARGVGVVVTDHHLPSADPARPGAFLLPAADALVDPKVASAPGFDHLCGAGVAFFLVGALVRVAAQRGLWQGAKFSGPLLVLAGLATVVDIVPLRDQNRILVAQSLAAFRALAPWGLRELLDRAARRPVELVARHYGFLFGPRINAAGRMDDATKALALILAQDREQARRAAFEVDGFNVARKNEEDRVFKEARAQILSYDDLEAVVVADSPEHPWHMGVAGIVAARIMEEAHVPVAVYAGTHGSVRAPKGYHVRDALAASAEALERFGGHAAAGGFTVKPGALARFRELFEAACAAQHVAHTEEIAHACEPDLWLEPADLARTPSGNAAQALFDAIRKMEPFGEGNPEPVFGLRNMTFAAIRPVGLDGKHLSCEFTNRALPHAVWWSHGHEVETLRARAAGHFDVLFSLFVSDYGADAPHVEFRLVDVRPATIFISI